MALIFIMGIMELFIIPSALQPEDNLVMSQTVSSVNQESNGRWTGFEELENLTYLKSATRPERCE